jgi:hypothetical protein
MGLSPFIPFCPLLSLFIPFYPLAPETLIKWAFAAIFRQHFGLHYFVNKNLIFIFALFSTLSSCCLWTKNARFQPVVAFSGR